MFPGYRSAFLETDPEFIERFDNFVFDEVVTSDDLDDKTRFTAILSSLLGCQGIDEYRAMLPAALNFGVTPVEVKEIVYQSVAYLGIGRAFPFLKATNDVLLARGVKLPLAGQAGTTMENRLEAGEQAQIDIFGAGMRGFADTGRDTNGQVNKWLVDNCFGDWYTRGGLDYKQREMITFCFLAAQGGCEPQLTSHAAANMRVGNDREFLVKVVSQCVPYIGYPRAERPPLCERGGKKIKKRGKKTMANLIVYYSRRGENYWNGTIKNLSKGNTEIAAGFIQKAVGGDLFEVQTVKEYAKDYYACIEEAKRELREGARPALKVFPENIGAYDHVFIGYPNWWGTMPMAMFTFLERFDWTGKTVHPFCTNEGSGMGVSERDLKKVCRGALVRGGLSVHGAETAQSEGKIAAWAKKSME